MLLYFAKILFQWPFDWIMVELWIIILTIIRVFTMVLNWDNSVQNWDSLIVLVENWDNQSLSQSRTEIVWLTRSRTETALIVSVQNWVDWVQNWDTSVGDLSRSRTESTQSRTETGPQLRYNIVLYYCFPNLTIEHLSAAFTTLCCHLP